MNEKFFDLKQEKQDRIINSLLRVFGIYDYQHASTDDIVKYAGISKGLLFHYFDNKIGAYAFAYEFIVRFWKMELSQTILKEADPFVIFERRELARLQIMRRYPYLHLFLEKCQEETNEEAVKRVDPFREDMRMAGMIPYTYQLDRKLPRGVSEEQLFTITELTIQGILRNYDRELILGRGADIEEVYKDIITHINVIKMLV